jgi:hypothetical protein
MRYFFSFLLVLMLYTTAFGQAVNPMEPPYNATGNGVTDDSAAICQAAHAVLPGGTLLFPPGYTFFVNSNQSGFYGCKLEQPLTIDFQGSSLLIGTGTLDSYFGFAKGGTYTTLTSYPIVAATRGATSVTLLEPANASNFTVGHVLFIHGELTDNDDRGQNVITSINPLTGVIGLQLPLGKPYSSGTPGISDAEISTIRNITIRNANVSWVGPNGAQFVDFERTFNTQLLFNNINATNLTTTEPVQGNASLYVLWLGNNIVSGSPNGGGTEVGGQGSVMAQVIGNTVSQIGPGANVLGSCEGCESIVVQGNKFSAVGSSTATAMAQISGSYDYSILNNKFAYTGPTFKPGWALISTGAPGAVNDVIQGNVINSAAYNAINAQGFNDTISNNTISSPHACVVVNPSGTDIIVGNQFSCSGNGISIENAQGAENSIITGNEN